MNLFSQALEAPDVNCVQTQANGDAIVTWDLISDPNGEFVSYDIYYSDDGFTSPATLVGTVPDILNTTFLHVGAGADAASGCYYILVNSNDGSPQVSASSDTICSVYITATPSTGPSGYADIQIEGPYQFMDPPDPNIIQEIYLNYPPGEWNLISAINIDEDEFQYEVDVCDVYYEFQVLIDNQNGCTFESNIAGDDFVDTTPPPIPTIEYVTVDSVTLDIEVVWEGYDPDNTQGYIIYQCLSGGLSTPVDTVFGGDNTSYIYETSFGPLTGGFQFTVAAFDFCEDGDDFQNISPTEDICHQTIFLANPQWFQCQDFVTLNWTEYVGWEDEGGVGFYEILFKENFGAEQSAGIVDGNTTTFVHENLNQGSLYRYYIKAHDIFGINTSLSNSQTQNLQTDPPPSYTYIFSTTVVDESEVSIALCTEDIPFDHQYVLEKKNPFNNLWEAVDSEWTSLPFLSFFDYEVDTEEEIYEYRVSVINDCGDTVRVSNTGRTMMLNGVENSDNVSNTISWTPYGDWDFGVQQYRIYRSKDFGDLGTVIATVGGGDTNFEDQIGDIPEYDSGLYCYTVEAVESPGSACVNEGASFSNQVCLQLSTQIWVPNAFMINGVNNTWRPVLYAADYDNYLLKIFSRWGDAVFETTDPEEGWDGTKNGTLLQEGQYGWYIAVKDGEGRLYEERGTLIMLIGE